MIIPKPLLIEIGSKAGDQVEMLVEAGRIVIAPIHAHPRARWAEDARRLAEAGDDALIWPEFANVDDGELIW